MSKIPIRILTPDAPPHEQLGRIEYIVASNGPFISIKNDWVDAIVPTTEIGGLAEQKKTQKFKLPPMPRKLVYQVLKFFREVSDQMHTEAAVLLHYGADTGWAVNVPKQEVTPAHVYYKVEIEDRIPDKRIIGTMHSHVNMNAGHSGTDDKDEAMQDGLHVTFGRVNDLPGLIDIDAIITVRGTKFPIPCGEFCDGGFTEAKAQQKKPTDPTPGRFESWWNHGTSSHRLVDTKLYGSIKVPKSWHSRVSKQKFSWTQPQYGGSRLTDEEFYYTDIYGEPRPWNNKRRGN